MRVYSLNNDVNSFQYFLTARAKDAMLLITECRQMLTDWEPPEVYIYEPLHKKGDLLNFSGSSPIFSPHATEALRTYLEMAGELLPLPFEGEVYTLLNVTECINCLDQAASVRTSTGRVTKYVFHPDRFSESDIFKIPETYRSEVLVVDRENGEDSFVSALREHNIRGYELTLLWSDSAES